MNNQYNPENISKPADTLADLIEERGIKEEELANRMECSIEQVKDILDGAPITEDIALSLEKALGTPYTFWIAREQRYRNNRG